MFSRRPIVPQNRGRIATSGPRIIFWQNVTGATVLQAVQSDLGITLNGSTVSAWADQSGAGLHYTQGTASKQPTLSAGLNGFSGVLFDGTDDALTSSLNLPAPGTTPTWIWMVFRMTGTQAGAQFVLSDSNGTAMVVYIPAGGGQSMQMYNGAAVNVNAGTTTNTWGVAEIYFSNSASDYFRFAATHVNTGNALNTDAVANRQMGAQTSAGLNPAKLEILACLHANARPAERSVTAGGNGKLAALARAKYGSLVGT